MGQSSRELNQTMLAKRIHDTSDTAHGEERDPNKLQSSLLRGTAPASDLPSLLLDNDTQLTSSLSFYPGLRESLGFSVSRQGLM